MDKVHVINTRDIRFGGLASIVTPGFAEAKASRAQSPPASVRRQSPRAAREPLHAWLYRAHPPGIRCPIAARGARGPQAPHHLPLRSVSPGRRGTERVRDTVHILTQMNSRTGTAQRTHRTALASDAILLSEVGPTDWLEVRNY